MTTSGMVTDSRVLRSTDPYCVYVHRCVDDRLGIPPVTGFHHGGRIKRVDPTRIASTLQRTGNVGCVLSDDFERPIEKSGFVVDLRNTTVVAFVNQRGTHPRIFFSGVPHRTFLSQ